MRSLVPWCLRPCGHIGLDLQRVNNQLVYTVRATCLHLFFANQLTLPRGQATGTALYKHGDYLQHAHLMVRDSRVLEKEDEEDQSCFSPSDSIGNEWLSKGNKNLWVWWFWTRTAAIPLRITQMNLNLHSHFNRWVPIGVAASQRESRYYAGGHASVKPVRFC